MTKHRLSIVYYLNALPLSWGFLHGDQRDVFELDFSPPSRCADLLSEGKVDVGLIPVIEYQRIAGLKVIPGLSVASKQAVKSVLLLSKVPAPQIRTVAADSSSRTSICLLQILLQERFKASAVVSVEGPDLPAMLAQNDAALIIGDAALKARATGLHRYDLAEEWWNLTGKPFVFAFWGVRKEIDLSDSTVFDRSFRYGQQRTEEIVADQSRLLGLPADLIRSYITETIDYSLDDENLEALRLFFQLAREYRLIGSAQELRFLS